MGCTTSLPEDEVFSYARPATCGHRGFDQPNTYSARRDPRPNATEMSHIAEMPDGSVFSYARPASYGRRGFENRSNSYNRSLIDRIPATEMDRLPSAPDGSVFSYSRPSSYGYRGFDRSKVRRPGRRRNGAITTATGAVISYDCTVIEETEEPPPPYESPAVWPE